MKWLILLVILLILFAMIASRYSRQIASILHLWRTLKNSNQRQADDRSKFQKQDESDEVRLVKCSGCEAWTPEKNSLKLRSGTFYCSSDCLEKAVKVL